MKKHNLKIYPKYFKEVISGNKTYEIRKNDRNFKEGDIVILKEFDGVKYTGREVEKIIGYIISDKKYTKDGYVVFSIKDITGRDK